MCNTNAQIVGTLAATCKYGENAWQTPAHLYSTGTSDPLALDRFTVIEGTSPSYNNLVDLDRLLQTATHIAEAYAFNDTEIDYQIAVGVKHGNPCGAAVGIYEDKVFAQMIKGDMRAIFGGLVLTNFKISRELLETFPKIMLDGIIAPDFDPEAIALLRRKGNKCRFIVNPALANLRDMLDRTPRFRYVRGGFLVQPNYTYVPDFMRHVTKYGTTATLSQERDMLLAWAIGSTSNSNTITLVHDGQLIGNGVGQQDRVGAAKLAIARAVDAEHHLAGAVAYSDSFFPFPDGPEELIRAGSVSAILTSSGSINDQKTIDLCEKHRVALYMIPDSICRGFYNH